MARSIREAALRIGVSERVLRDAIARDELRAYRPPGSRRAVVRDDDADVWLSRWPASIPPRVEPHTSANTTTSTPADERLAKIVARERDREVSHGD